MTSYSTSKANGLFELLAAGLPVPEFSIIKRGEKIVTNLPEPLIVRSCLQEEDQAESSQAGLGQSIGPISRSELQNVIQKLFEDFRVVEVIVQHFVDAPTGVLFSLTEGGAYFEYGRESRCVTDGRASPFCATFPNQLAKYNNLARYLSVLNSRFKNFNAELSFGESISFFQIRPITRPLSVNLNAAKLKMELQEIDFEILTQTEFCHDILESPGKELSLIRIFCEIMPVIFEELEISYLPFQKKDFIRIGNQIFMKGRIPTLDLSSKKLVTSLARWALKECFSSKKNLNEPQRLMRRAFALRTLYELPGITQLKPIRNLLLESRLRCREDLVNLLDNCTLDPSIHTDRLLNSPILKSNQKLIWERFEFEAELGEVVVAGDFDKGPFLKWPFEAAEKSDKKVTVLCDELYPAIGRLFSEINGIICRRGSITSHLAILARERNIPLWIRVPQSEFTKRLPMETASGRA